MTDTSPEALLPEALTDDQRRAVWLAQYRLAASRLSEPQSDSACLALANERVASDSQRASDLAAWRALRETLLPGVRALAAERDAVRRLNGEYEDHITDAEAELDAARAEVERLRERVAWLEEIREGAGRALCAMDGIAPDEPIADGGHVAWELHVYQRAHAALKAWVTASVSAALAAKEGGQ